MTRILIVETASPKRIVHKVEQIREAGLYPDPEIDILCQARTSQAYSGLPAVKIWAMASGGKHRLPKELVRKKFDIVFAFWTGEKKYRWMKFLTLRINTGHTYITAGDGNEFRLTWKAICRHTIFRLKHPLPTDHYDFAMPPAPQEAPGEKEKPESKELQEEMAYHAGERVLVIQSAEPEFVLKALEKLGDQPDAETDRIDVPGSDLEAHDPGLAVPAAAWQGPPPADAQPRQAAGKD